MNKKIVFGSLAVAFVFLFLGILSLSLVIWQYELRTTTTDSLKRDCALPGRENVSSTLVDNEDIQEGACDNVLSISHISKVGFGRIFEFQLCVDLQRPNYDIILFYPIFPLCDRQQVKLLITLLQGCLSTEHSF